MGGAIGAFNGALRFPWSRGRPSPADSSTTANYN